MNNCDSFFIFPRFNVSSTQFNKSKLVQPIFYD